MHKQSFEYIISHLKTSIADYKYYVSFDKVYENSKNHSDKLKILNQLIGSKNIANDFENLVEKYPQVINCIPSLLATRNQTLPILDQKVIEYNFNSKVPMAISDYVTFMQKTGLFELLETNKIHDLRDYYFGVEVGMDTNGRKNRTGSIMEKLVESFIVKAKPDKYYKEMTKKEIAKKFNLNLDDLITKKNGNKEAEKRFDFVVQNKNQIFLIETNFYGSNGSKLNETARSFKALNNSLKDLPNIHFIWITDGIGWKKTQNNLREAYQEIDHLYTINDLEDRVLEKLWY